MRAITDAQLAAARVHYRLNYSFVELSQLLVVPRSTLEYYRAQIEEAEGASVPKSSA